MKDYIIESIKESIEVKEKTIEILDDVADAAREMCACIQRGGKIIIMGNGGSAADAQHIAAELVGRFEGERRPLAAIALSTDTSILTSVSNDYGFRDVFAKQIIALASPKDLVIGISTSGNSPNVFRAIEAAEKIGAFTIAFTGKSGGKLKNIADICLRVPSERVCRIQETHITLGHILCGIVENCVLEETIAK